MTCGTRCQNLCSVSAEMNDENLPAALISRLAAAEGFGLHLAEQAGQVSGVGPVHTLPSGSSSVPPAAHHVHPSWRVNMVGCLKRNPEERN